MSKRKPRRKALGKPLADATEEDAAVTPQDIEQAKMYADKYGSDRLKAMLEAVPDDEGDFE